MPSHTSPCRTARPQRFAWAARLPRSANLCCTQSCVTGLVRLAGTRAHCGINAKVSCSLLVVLRYLLLSPTPVAQAVREARPANHRGPSSSPAHALRPAARLRGQRTVGSVHASRLGVFCKVARYRGRGSTTVQQALPCSPYVVATPFAASGRIRPCCAPAQIRTPTPGTASACALSNVATPLSHA